MLVEVLILTSDLDFATDRICRELGARDVSFLRLNRERLAECEFVLDPLQPSMQCRHGDCLFSVGSELRSVWWRQGTFDRNVANTNSTVEQQLSRTQWSAFMRAMMVFDNARWFNHPAAVYEAETKAIQLREATRIGFDVPATLMTNDATACVSKQIGDPVAIKSIDTLLLREGREQLFGYTTITKWQSIAFDDLRLAPLTVQAAVERKLDLRVTIIGHDLWCVSIKKADSGIEGDWRLTEKAALQIENYELPDRVAAHCRELVNRLGLRFGAIDLAFASDRYWFIEINPTGEWGWLDGDGRQIAAGIVENLAWAG